MSDETFDTFSIRLPRSMRRRLKRKAEQNLRSLNSELLFAVRAYLNGSDKEPTSEVAHTAELAAVSTEPDQATK